MGGKAAKVFSSDVNARNAFGYTALHSAVFHVDASAVRKCLETEGVDVNLPSRGYTPLLLAAWHGTLEVFQAVACAPTVVLDVVDSAGDGVLHVIVKMPVVPDREAKLVWVLPRLPLPLLTHVNAAGATAEQVARAEGFIKLGQVSGNVEK
jgi:ankyrin repeat protein